MVTHNNIYYVFFSASRHITPFNDQYFNDLFHHYHHTQWQQQQQQKWQRQGKFFFLLLYFLLTNLQYRL